MLLLEWLALRLRPMSACRIEAMTDRRLECRCGMKFEADEWSKPLDRVRDDLLDRWNAHRAGMRQNGR